jgi:hypothetical protein
MMPNLVVNFLGMPWAHSALSEIAGAGSIRLEKPLIGIVVLWMVPSVYAVFGLSRLASECRGAPRTGLWLAALAAAMSLSTLLILSYATVTLRYKSEIWPLIFVLAVFGFYDRAGAYGSRYLLDSGGRGSRPTLAKAPVWIMLVVSVAACSVAVFDLKSNPFFNGDPQNMFVDLRHPDMSGL